MPYIPHTEDDVRAMLATIGVESVEDLFAEIPENLRLRRPLNVPSALDEHHLFITLKRLAEKNLDATKLAWFLGAGIYDRFIPATVSAIISRGEFLTAYTPYQPELSQGYLQSIYEFQSMIAELYGMEVANASMYDGSTSMAEAAIVAAGINGRSKVVVSRAVHPNYRQVLDSYCWSTGLTVVELDVEDGLTANYSPLDEETACLIVQSPNFFGGIEDLREVRAACDRSGAIMIVVSDPVACALLCPPGEYGADIVVGEGQPLGVAMGFGGPLVGLFACKSEYVRRIPGRIVGRTTDSSGRTGYVMTLRTREQDIRREKATSNICTNEALMALANTVYLSALGKNGLRSVAESTVRNAHYALQKLTEAGAKRKFGSRFFGEFVIELPMDATEVQSLLIDRGIMPGLPLGTFYGGMEKCLLVACTEVRTREEIDRYGAELKAILSSRTSATA